MKRQRRLVLVIISFLIASLPASAADKRVPPYPDVWGQELPGVARYLAASEGDILIAYSVTQPGQAFDDGAFWLEGFFDGNRRQVTNPEFHAIYDAAAKSNHSLGSFSNKQRIVFADGSVIDVEEMMDHRDDRWTCDIPAPMIVKHDAKGKMLWRKAIVRLLERPLAVRADQNCSDGGQNFVMKVQFWSLSYNELYGLDDGTFIAWFNGAADNDDVVNDIPADGPERRFAIRFDAELGSPYLKTLPDVVVVDAKVLEPVIADAVKHHHASPAAGRRYFHDRVYDALSKIKASVGP